MLFSFRPCQGSVQPPCHAEMISDIAKFCSEVVELLLGIRVLLGHVLILRLPLVTSTFESLHLSLIMAGFDICLA